MATPLVTPLYSPLALSSSRNRHSCPKIGFQPKNGKTFDYNATQKLNLSRLRKTDGQSTGFLQMGFREMSFGRKLSTQAMDGAGTGNTSTIPRKVFATAHLLVSLGIILAADQFLKQAFVAASIKFPSALFGMFCIFSVLMILDSVVPAAATGMMNFFEPAFLFIQRWLPLFYVPSLVVLPLSVRDIPAASGVKICYIVAGFTAIAVRKMVKTEMTEAEPMAKPSPFSTLELWSWSGIFVVSFVGALFYPTSLGTSARTCLPFLLSSTVLGYIVGSGLPSSIKKVFHPIICCALSSVLAALAFGYASGSGLDPLVKRHAAEIFTSVIVSTVFSLYSTALVGRLVGLEPSLTVSILPRCITVALALSIVSLFEGTNSSLTAAVVVVTGLIGANFVQVVLDKLRLRDPIARGIATASRTQSYRRSYRRGSLGRSISPKRKRGERGDVSNRDRHGIGKRSSDRSDRYDRNGGGRRRHGSLRRSRSPVVRDGS
ncbi:hypothetical protein Bca101_067415 [Brassica carinata]